MLQRNRMPALVSALVGLATVLGLWFAVSLVSAPVLVLCIRSQARANARLTSALRRRAWPAALRR